MCSTAPSWWRPATPPASIFPARTIDSHIRNIRAKFAEAGSAESDRDGARRRLQARAVRRVKLTEDKWRPRIGLVVLAILLTVMALPLVGLFFFRIYENQLVRQTEAELIGQGAAIAAIYAREVREAALPPDKLGAAVAAEPDRASSSDLRSEPDEDWPYRPIEPSLDLAVDSDTRAASGCAAGDAGSGLRGDRRAA